MPPPACHILHVEDDANDAFFLRRRFERSEVAASLMHLADGQQALAFFSGEGIYADRDNWPLPELVLLDLKLPKTDGFEVLAWIRAQPHLQDLPVLVLSSSDREDDKARARALGATEYLAKTPGLEDIVERVVSRLSALTGKELD